MKLHRVRGSNESVGYSFFCPGCNEVHVVWTQSTVHHVWDFNGDLDRPTFHPSIMITGGHYVPGFKLGDQCWCTYNKENPGMPASFKCMRCHSYIRAGRIEFLSDCTHELKGTNVEIPDFDDSK